MHILGDVYKEENWYLSEEVYIQALCCLVWKQVHLAGEPKPSEAFQMINTATAFPLESAVKPKSYYIAH